MSNKLSISGCRPWVFSGNKIVITGHCTHSYIDAKDIKIKLLGVDAVDREIHHSVRYKKTNDGYLINIIVDFNEIPKKTEELKVYYLGEQIYGLRGNDICNIMNEICYDIVDIKNDGKYLEIKGWIAGGSVVVLGLKYAGDKEKKKLKVDYEGFDAIEYHSHILEAVRGNNGFILKVKKPKYPITLMISSDGRKCIREVPV